MAPPNESKPTPKVAATPAPKLAAAAAAAAAATAKGGPASSSSAPCLFSLHDGELSVCGDGNKAALLTGVPGNVTLTPFAEAFDPAASAAPRALAERAAANARRGAFLGFALPAPGPAASRAPCRVGRLAGPRRFLSLRSCGLGLVEPHRPSGVAVRGSARAGLAVPSTAAAGGCE